MGPLRATVKRTVGRSLSLYSTAFAVGGFLSVAALSFARSLDTADGCPLALPVLWASGVSPVLPVLAALLGMDAWSEERRTGRIDSLLTVAVREREFVLGKWFGVLSLLLLSVLSLWASSVAFLHVYAPQALFGVSAQSWLFALLALTVQGSLWSAVAVAASAVFRHAASAAVATVLAVAVLPRCVWEGLMAWSRGDRAQFGDLPLDAHVVDIASGVLPLGTIALYLSLTVLALFVASKCVAAVRLVGRGAMLLRMSTAFSVALSVILSVLLALVLSRVNPVADLSSVGTVDDLSSRTRSILSESSGTVTVTVFLPREDPAARAAGRILRLLKRQSESVGGVRIELRFVDPRWDIGAAERLIRRGAEVNSLVFEKGRRMVSVAVKDGFGERLCASTIRRISSPPHRRNVYWTVGHGEFRFDDYTAFGMSDIARDLFREGFGNATVDLSSDQQIPGDCALMLVAGARDDFSRAELDRLNAYLREGGRLLVMLGSSRSGGVVSLLPSWGLRPYDRPLQDVRSLSGTDVIVTDFTDHPISRPLRGSRIVLERPVAFAPSAVADRGTGVDRIGYMPVAEVDAAAVVASVERGGGAGDDLALRPTRLVVVGDAGFAINGQLTARASANRDFFLNCVAYLSGAEAHGAGDEVHDRFLSGMDRTSRRRHARWSAVLFPVVVALTLFAVAFRRRHRT